MSRMSRRVLALVLAVVCALAITAAPAGAATHRVLTALSYNIHHAAGTDGVLDLGRIARVIRASRADVVGLQEVDRHFSGRSDWADQATELARRLGFHVVFGANIDRDPPAPGRPRIQYGTAILSRHPIVESRNTYLFRSPDQEQRGLLHAELNVHGVPVHVYDTHLAASSALDRAEQAREIVDLVGGTGTAVLLGDLNAIPGAPEIRTIGAELTDAWPVSGQDDGSGGATYPAEDPDRRIDYVFTGSSVRPLWSRVLRTDPVASDHLPLVSRLLVRGGR
ncbi:endonuclease/exonuclease/phosphatase family protein [Qaidamihabitans albus]|uniref:endonuclease/exonuclease/phosphatase family protein n=1 Tax=Qaidamihabitans albus TaxID=2795733 RepID=UPI001F1EB0DE|nr:endonuclease/exonuclease/phosphatase family protein [Qaidamihabitans albus]